MIYRQRKQIKRDLFPKKDADRGVILVMTMFLLLIIASLTIAFLYLQFTEVELIADETDYLQAFYLASAGLEQGRKTLTENESHVISQLRVNPNEIWINPNSYTNVFLETDKQGRYYHQFKLISDQSTEQLISIQGIGVINDHGRLVKDVYKSTSSSGPEPPEPHPREPEIVNVFDELEWPLVVSKTDIVKNQQVMFIDKCVESQPKAITSNPDDPSIKYLDAINITSENKGTINQVNTVKKIQGARFLNTNANGLLFANRKLDYYSEWLKNINVDYKEFKYTDTRKTSGGKTSIQPTMEIKANQEVIFQSGTYFFEKLKLREYATVRTNGYVSIYTTDLRLETGARMIGSEGEDINPYYLIIMAEYWPGYSYRNEFNRVDIGSGARLTGIIFSPRLRVYLRQGSIATNETRVNGAILTNQLIVTGSSDTTVGWARVACQNMGDRDSGKVPGEWKEGLYP